MDDLKMNLKVSSTPHIREKNSIEDIMLVEGIDEGSFDKIQNIISIGVEHEDTGS